MTDILIRVEGKAGRITLNRPEALNALTRAMAAALEAALTGWQDDPAVALVLIDATGPRAFCAGGDIAELFAHGTAGDFAFGQQFWREEYRMNARIAEYPKPVVSLMQGFAMGGGVGLGCHASHRIVCETSRIALPECGIGLVPDVGGSALLARAPGRLGEYLGTTGRRMGPGDAIFAGFADAFVPEADWPALKAALIAGGDPGVIPQHSPPEASLPALMPQISAHFAGQTLGDIWRSLAADASPFARQAQEALAKASPLAAAAAVEMQHRLGTAPPLRRALELEYRYAYRAQQHGDFLEGIRAMIIDKDRTPRWRHSSAEAVPLLDVSRMLLPLGPLGLTFTEG